MKLIEMAEAFPEQTEPYRALQSDAEACMADLKKLYDNILTLNLSVMSLQLRLSTLVENVNGTQLILAQDVLDLLPDDEEQPDGEK